MEITSKMEMGSLLRFWPIRMFLACSGARLDMTEFEKRIEHKLDTFFYFQLIINGIIMSLLILNYFK